MDKRIETYASVGRLVTGEVQTIAPDEWELQLTVNGSTTLVPIGHHPERVARNVLKYHERMAQEAGVVYEMRLIKRVTVEYCKGGV